MKKSVLIDIVFIILMSGVVLLITETGNAAVINRYIIVFLLSAYFIGKYAGSKNWEIKK